MGQVIQVNGDYNIKAKSGSSITLDPGITGDVIVVGNLVVEGKTISIETQDLFIRDNIILLNDGEVGPGVTLGISGIEIDRGSSANNVGFFWNEQTSSWSLVSAPPSSNFSVDSNSRLTLKEILTDAEVDDGNLTLIGSGTGVVTVAGTDNYEQQVTQDDHLPNKRYTDNAIFNRPNYRVGVGTTPANPSNDPFLKTDNTMVLVSDALLQDSVDDHEQLTGQSFSQSVVSVIVNSVQPPTAQFFQNSVRMQNIRVTGDEISNVASGGDVYVKTLGDGKLRVNNSIRIEYSNQPGSIPNSSLLYAAAPAAGTTGLYFVNHNSVSQPQNKTGELISKNRALVYSMIF